jgi:hypothetical protein
MILHHSGHTVENRCRGRSIYLASHVPYVDTSRTSWPPNDANEYKRQATLIPTIRRSPEKSDCIRYSSSSGVILSKNRPILLTFGMLVTIETSRSELVGSYIKQGQSHIDRAVSPPHNHDLCQLHTIHMLDHDRP